MGEREIITIAPSEPVDINAFKASPIAKALAAAAYGYPNEARKFAMEEMENDRNNLSRFSSASIERMARRFEQVGPDVLQDFLITLTLAEMGSTKVSDSRAAVAACILENPTSKSNRIEAATILEGSEDLVQQALGAKALGKIQDVYGILRTLSTLKQYVKAAQVAALLEDPKAGQDIIAQAENDYVKVDYVTRALIAVTIGDTDYAIKAITNERVTETNWYSMQQVAIGLAQSHPEQALKLQQQITGYFTNRDTLRAAEVTANIIAALGPEQVDLQEEVAYNFLRDARNFKGKHINDRNAGQSYLESLIKIATAIAKTDPNKAKAIAKKLLEGDMYDFNSAALIILATALKTEQENQLALPNPMNINE